LTGEERAKAKSRKEIEDCAAEPKTMKIVQKKIVQNITKRHLLQAYE
jgi:hypothetical protein